MEVNIEGMLRTVSKKKLRDYYTSNKQAEMPLTEWYYKIAESSRLRQHLSCWYYLRGKEYLSGRVQLF